MLIAELRALIAHMPDDGIVLIDTDTIPTDAAADFVHLYGPHGAHREAILFSVEQELT